MFRARCSLRRLPGPFGIGPSSSVRDITPLREKPGPSGLLRLVDLAGILAISFFNHQGRHQSGLEGLLIIHNVGGLEGLSVTHNVKVCGSMVPARCNSGCICVVGQVRSVRRARLARPMLSLFF